MFPIPFFQYHRYWKAHCGIVMISIKPLGNQLRDMESILIKTAVLWGQDDVLTRAVDNLLTADGGWKVIRLCGEADEAVLSKVMEQVTPEALIINKGSIASDAALLVNLIQAHPKLMIVTIGLEDNSMEIYNKHTIYLNKASDLLSVIDEQSYFISEGGDH